MTSITTYSYRNREIFDLSILIEAIRFIVINLILALIFLFLALEEFDWATLSSKNRITDEIIDETSWNIKTLILKS
tara:strand:+ start:64 stop:291 length:228 start_codon:yes stop_codon:yes gene_type:complete